ncbi:hypothetical protein BDV30DRAFT_234880 [Aspergillus minisclerotigenes]|uniref:Uncharacterized protein n=1 Tax=Aspergillus minisclerotigenes TaxID=656917 RepID=A0A5N6JFJ5_9EURO|nr:hypothetical protein BDV30DRAFT_234880 [Aspergillus minisclerotigenes]
MHYTQVLVSTLAALPAALTLDADLAYLYAGNYIQPIPSSYATACVPFNYPDPAEYISVNPRKLVGVDIVCDLYDNPFCRGSPAVPNVRGQKNLEGDNIVAGRCYIRPIGM